MLTTLCKIGKLYEVGAKKELDMSDYNNQIKKIGVYSQHVNFDDSFL
jgi:hypothetical protein